MCTSIIEIAPAEGMAKRGDAWFPLSTAVVAYDHARHAPLGDVITLDFVNAALDAGARAVWVVQAGTSISHRVRGGLPNSVNLLRHDTSADAGASHCSVEQWDFDEERGTFVQARCTQALLTR